MNLRSVQRAVGIETDLELCEEWMAMAGDGHVLITIEAHAHRLAGVMWRQRGERVVNRRLLFLAAETAAQARALHDDFVCRQMQYVRDDLLHLRRMLCGRRDQHRAVLSAPGPCSL